MKTFLVLLMLISSSFSSTWSSNINSLFSVRNMMHRTVDVSTDLIESVAYGVQMAMDHCRNIFKWDRWNCPESAFSRRRQQSATKEQAMAHAIVSAGLVHSVTRNCSRGELQGCGCDPNLRGPMSISEKYILKSIRMHKKQTENDWAWGGCSDNVEFGQKVAKKVLDQMEQGSDPQAYANLQNNLVGRMVGFKIGVNNGAVPCPIQSYAQ